MDAAKRLIAQGHKNPVAELLHRPLEGSAFEEMTITHFDRTRAYIKIEDGCENRCTYCAIPSARGPVRSKSPLAVLREVRTLVDGGCREVVLTGIETASYGRDLGSFGLADLLEAVDAIPGIGRVRLGSLDPSLMKQEVNEMLGGVTVLAEYLEANDMVANSTQAVNMITPASDDLEITITQIGEIVKKYSWQMVYASDEAEFESLWSEMVGQAEQLGLDQVTEYYTAEWEKALELVKDYE